MKLPILTRIKEITSKKDRISQNQRIKNIIGNYSSFTQTNTFSDSQNRNQIQLVKIYVKRSQAWALHANRNQRIV